jgi:hypothetical protein
MHTWADFGKETFRATRREDRMNSVTSEARVGAKLQKLRQNLTSVIRGKDAIVEDVIVALVAGGLGAD